ncbi:MAG TPA: hypothetical protein VGL87_15860 [Steroidobacteraceae bacterium]
MTIRDYIKRRVRWGFGIGVASWLVIAISGPMGFGGPKLGYLPVIGVFGFMGAIASFLFIRCPKCSARLGQTIAMPAAFRLFGPQVKYCPYCGVSLDEPIER